MVLLALAIEMLKENRNKILKKTDMKTKYGSLPPSGEESPTFDDFSLQILRDLCMALLVDISLLFFNNIFS